MTTTEFTFAERIARACFHLKEKDPFLFFLAIQYPRLTVKNPGTSKEVVVLDDAGKEKNITVPEEHQISTAATDYKNYYYNENFCGPLKDSELRFVVAHETCHVAFAHNQRRENRHPSLANVAMDYVINLMLNDAMGEGAGIAQRIISIPKIKDHAGRQVSVGMFDKKYKGMVFEEVYEALKKDLREKWQKAKKEAQKNGTPMPGGSGSNADGDFLDDIFDENGNPRTNLPKEILDIVRTLDKNSGDMTPEQSMKAQTAIGKALQQAKEFRAREAAKGRGINPSDFERMAEDGFKPHSKWHEELRSTLQGKGTQDCTWGRPNKRYLGLPFGDRVGVYLPSRLGVSYGNIAVCIDTSGSMSEDMLSQFCAEMNNLLRQSADCKIYLYDCDAAARLQGVYRQHQKIEPKFVGGGGTSFVPAFEEILRQHRRDPFNTIVYFTDLDGTMPTFDVPVKTIWLVPDSCKDKVPFGKVIPIPVEKR